MTNEEQAERVLYELYDDGDCTLTATMSGDRFVIWEEWRDVENYWTDLLRVVGIVHGTPCPFRLGEAPPEADGELVEQAEELWRNLVPNWGFSDECTTCAECGRLIQAEPDSCRWTPDFVVLPDGIFHATCADTDKTLEETRNG